MKSLIQKFKGPPGLDSKVKGFRGSQGEPGQPGKFGTPGQPGPSGDPGDTVLPEDAYRYNGAKGDQGFPGRPGEDVYIDVDYDKISPGPKGQRGEPGMVGVPGRTGGKGALGDRVNPCNCIKTPFPKLLIYFVA